MRKAKTPKRKAGFEMAPESEDLKGKCRAMIKMGARKGQPCSLTELKVSPGACSFHARSASALPVEGVGTKIRSARFGVRPTVTMRRILAQWFGVSRVVWNACVDIDRGLDISMEVLRKRIVSGKNYPAWMLECPAHVRAETVREYIAARTAALSNYERKMSRYKFLRDKQLKGELNKRKPLREPKRPVMKHRTKKAPRAVLHIPKEDVKVCDSGFAIYGRIVKGLCDNTLRPKTNGRKSRLRDELLAVTSSTRRKDKAFLDLVERGFTAHDVRLLRTREGRFTMEVPVDKTVVDVAPENDVVAVDPGVRVPFSCADTDGVFNAIGADFVQRAEATRARHAKLHARIADLEIKRARGARHIRKEMRALDRKLIAMRTQFHYETAGELLKYRDIVLPTVNHAGWMARGALSSTTHRQVQQIAHPLFRARLMNKAELCGGRRITDCDEFRTSKTCGRCFSVNDKLGSSKLFHCQKCGLKLDRDFNAARNILLLNVVEDRQ